jgi:amino acid transporter/GNAT superfamily N-acetyltransferase
VSQVASPKVVRAIGRWSLAALMVNVVIGSGIFGLPSKVAAFTGTQSPWAFLIAGAGIAVIAACFAEVASRFTESGGPYLYASAAFGRLVGLQTGWLSWLTRLASTAAGVNLFTVYLAEFWPAVEKPAVRVIALTLLLAVFTVINVRGVKMGAGVSNYLAVIKLIPLLVFVFAGTLYLQTHARPVPDLHESHDTHAWLNAILLILFAYVGFEGALIPAGESKSPDRNAPLAILTTLALCTPLYALTQWVVVRTLPDPTLTDRPVAAAAHVFGGAPLAILVAVGVLLSILGYLAASMVATPRITFAFAERNDFPRWFASVHPRYRTPHVSIMAFATLVWGLAMVGNFTWNAKLAAVSRLVTYAVSCAALPVLRRKNAGRAQFRLPMGNVFAVLGIVFCAVMLTRAAKSELLVLGVVLAIALVNWALVARKREESTAPSNQLFITRAHSPEELSNARTLLMEYWRHRNLSLSFLNFNRELEGLPGEYAPPSGGLLLGSFGGQAVGCVALRRLDAEICEMKRLYLRKEFHGRGFGRQLAVAMIANARALGYRKMRLDTIGPSMREAVALYRTLGFREIPAYRNNPFEGAIYLELEL